MKRLKTNENRNRCLLWPALLPAYKAVILSELLITCAAPSASAQLIPNGSSEEAYTGWSASGNRDSDPSYPATLVAEVPVISGLLTLNNLAAVEALAGITFTAAQRNQILQLLQGGVGGLADGKMLSLDGWRTVRSIPLLNSDQPALVFDPKPLGFEVNSNQEPLQWSAPAATVPSDRAALAFYPVRELAELIRTRQLSSMELTQLYLERLKRYDPTLLCVVTLTEDLALRKAQEADQEIAAGRYRGLLHGIPYGLKDLFAVRGYPTTWGAQPYRNQVLDQDSAVYRKLDQAGAVLVAKLTTGALAAGDKWFGGQTRNPWDPTTSSGGSSSGPAAATAAGLVAFAIGTETMGSIVDPAAHCRVAGLRSSFGRVSRDGAMSLAWSMDKVGPICRSVEDCAIVLDAIRGADGSDRATVSAAFNYRAYRGLNGLRVGYVPGAVRPGDLSDIGALGAQLVRIALPDYPSGALLSILAVEAAAAFDHLTRDGGLDQLPGQEVNDLANQIRTARTVSAVDYLQADRLRRKLVEDFGDLFKSIDLFVTSYSLDNDFAMANLAGLPCVAVPVTGSGSLLFTGPLYTEARLLEIARAYQAQAGYQWQAPPLFAR